MKINGLARAVLFVSVGFIYLGSASGQDGEKPVRSLFSEYLELSVSIEGRGLTERQRNLVIQMRDDAFENLVNRGVETGRMLVDEYRSEELLGRASIRREFMKFSRETGIAKDEFLEFARNAVESADLTVPRDSFLTAALEFLGEHGDKSDLELMKRIDGHSNPTYAQVRDRYAARLEERLSLENRADQQSNVQGTLAEAYQNKDGEVENHSETRVGGNFSNLPIWSLFAIVVSIIVMLGLVIRRQRSQRRS